MLITEVQRGELGSYEPLNFDIHKEIRSMHPAVRVGNTGFEIQVLERCGTNFMHYTPEENTSIPDSEEKQRQYAITFLGALCTYVGWLNCESPTTYPFKQRFVEPLNLYTETNREMAMFIQRMLGKDIVELNEFGEWEVTVDIAKLLSDKYRFIYEDYLLPMKQVAETSNFLVMST